MFKDRSRPPLRDEPARERLGAVEAAEERDLDYGAEAVRRQLERRDGEVPGRVVDEASWTSGKAAKSFADGLPRRERRAAATSQSTLLRL